MRNKKGNIRNVEPADRIIAPGQTNVEAVFAKMEKNIQSVCPESAEDGKVIGKDQKFHLPVTSV